MGYEDLLSQYQLSDEERKNLLLGNLLLGISGGLMSNRGRGNIFGAAGSGIVQGAQLGQNAIADARRGKLDEFKMRMVGQEYDQKQQAALQAAIQQANDQAQLGGIFGANGPQLQKMGEGGPTPANAAAVAPPSPIDKYRQAAAYYASKGNAGQAKIFSEIADKMEEEFSTTPQPVRDASGAVRLAQFGKRGGSKVADGLTPAEKLHFSDTGDKAGVGQDPYSGATVFGGLPKTFTPDALLGSETTRRGQNMTDARAREFNAIQQSNAGFGRVGELRKEFNGLPQVKAYSEVQPVLQSAREAASTDTAAADLNLIYAAAKIMDPGSVVRESETTMVVNAGSPAERFKGQFNYVAGGGRLTPEARKQLMNEVESRGRGYESGYNAARKAYEGVAAKSGIPADQVFIEPFAGSAPQQKPSNATQGTLTPAEAAELEALRKKHGRR